MSNISRRLSLYPLRILLAFFLGLGVCSSFAQTSTIRLTDEQTLAYIASYSDLMSKFGTDVDGARAHYENSGLQEGRSISFNGLQYIASYPDLITVFGLDTETALRQYIRQGKNQGRLSNFDGLEYIASNVSVIGYLGTDANAAARHYITIGYKAGLKTASFDPLKYIASYADLIVAFGKNVVSGITHYITRGFSEGRTATFNTTQYLANYSDLRTAFGSNTAAATSHYITSGFSEGRSSTKPNSAPTVTINTSPSNTVGELTAYAVNSTVSLIANGTDVDGDRLTYSWTLQSKPATSTATLGSPNNSSSGLSPDKPGIYKLQVVVSDGQSTANASLVVTAGTPISGTLSGSTVLDKSLSPYVQTDRLAIPVGASLTIPAGVQLFGNNNIIQVQGAFYATGTQAEKVRLTKVYIQPVGYYEAPHDLKILQTELIGVLYPGTGSSYGSFVIEDSKLDISGQFFLPQMAKNSTLQRNYFSNNSYVTISLSQTKNIVVKNNSFPVGPPILTSFGIYGLQVLTTDASYGGTYDFSNNTFRTPLPGLTTAPFALRTFGNGTFDARNNYWGTNEVSAIDRLIFDNRDDLSNGTFVNYTPFLTTPDPLTPLQ